MQNLDTALITEEEAKEMVPNKKAFHEALQRNGLCVPPWGSKCLTQDYMERCRSGEFYVLRYIHLQIRPCPNPPLKRRIFEEIMKEDN